MGARWARDSVRDGARSVRYRLVETWIRSRRHGMVEAPWLRRVQRASIRRTANGCRSMPGRTTVAPARVIVAKVRDGSVAEDSGMGRSLPKTVTRRRGRPTRTCSTSGRVAMGLPACGRSVSIP